MHLSLSPPSPTHSNEGYQYRATERAWFLVLRARVGVLRFILEFLQCGVKRVWKRGDRGWGVYSRHGWWVGGRAGGRVGLGGSVLLRAMIKIASCPSRLAVKNAIESGWFILFYFFVFSSPSLVERVDKASYACIIPLRAFFICVRLHALHACLIRTCSSSQPTHIDDLFGGFEGRRTVSRGSFFCQVSCCCRFSENDP